MYYQIIVYFCNHKTKKTILVLNNKFIMTSNNILSHADNAYLWLVLGFALLQMCWYGADLLPAVQDSMHRYAG